MSGLRSAVVIAATVPLLLAGGHGRVVHAQHSPAQKLTFDGDVALWTVAVKPDKGADFEKIMTKLRDAFMKSPQPERRQQIAGWKVVRIDTPLPDGNLAYVHIINPVVRGADYAVMPALYEAYPEERQALYELYRGAFVKNLSVAAGAIAVDLAAAP
jgi:hypothetical protein